MVHPDSQVGDGWLCSEHPLTDRDQGQDRRGFAGEDMV
jgi:hypothetical protein